MISSIVWVPAGVADPNPKRYEMSAKELELLRLMDEQQRQQQQGVNEEEQAPKKIRGGLKVKTVTPPVDLPADLRMDEYSSDEDEGKELARIIGMQSGVVPEGVEDDEGNGNNDMNDDRDSDDDDTDGEASDDLADVPDTREYEPIDVEGLQAMGLNQIGNSAMHMEGLGEEDDDASEAENVRIADTDAIVLVAKTDEVSSPIRHLACRRNSTLLDVKRTPEPTFAFCLSFRRIFQESKFTCTTKERATCTCITTFHCLPIHSASPMAASAVREAWGTSVPSVRLVQALKYGIWMF